MHTILGRSPGELTVESLGDLVESGQPENRFIEYKRQLPDKSPESIQKMLEAVASFANTEGGTIIFGIGAHDGVPKKLVPLKEFNADRDNLRIQTLIREHLDPALTSVSPHEIKGTDGSFLALEIPRSLLAPHAVSFNARGQYWRRNSRFSTFATVASRSTPSSRPSSFRRNLQYSTDVVSRKTLPKRP